MGTQDTPDIETIRAAVAGEAWALEALLAAYHQLTQRKNEVGFQRKGVVVLAVIEVYIHHNKNDTFTVEGVNADLRHHIPTLARRSRCFPRKLENLQAVLAVFVRAYDRFGLQTHLYRSRHPGTSVPFSLFDFL